MGKGRGNKALQKKLGYILWSVSGSYIHLAANSKKTEHLQIMH